MEKKITILFFVLLPFTLSAQQDSSGKSHSIFMSVDEWFLNDAHSIYGYQYRSGKNYFEFGISLERKRLPFWPPGSYSAALTYFNYLIPRYIIKDTSLSLTINCIKLGYSHIFRPEKRLIAYPFVNFYFNYYRGEGTFVGHLTSSISGSDNYKLQQWQYLINLGYGFRYQISQKLSAKLDLGIGTSFMNYQYHSEFFGSDYLLWSWWANGFGRLGLYYHF